MPEARSDSVPEARSDSVPEVDRTIVALILSVFCSRAATTAGITALGKQMYDLTGREIDLGLLGLAEFAPAAVLVLVTGSVADRFDRRRIAGLAGVAGALLALTLAAYAATDPTRAAPIFVLVVGLGVARAFVAPAVRSLPADVVEFDQLPWLVARYSIVSQTAFIAGPVLAGFLYVVDPVLPFVAMAVLLTTSAVSIQFVHTITVRERPERTVGVRATLREAMLGLRFIRHQPVLLGAISLDLFAVLAGGAVALLPAIADDRLGVDASGLGVLQAAVGIGAATMTIWLARRPVRRRVGPTLIVSVAVFGLFTMLLGLTTNFVVAWVALALLSAADAISVFIRSTLVPLVTPSQVRGRVLAVEMVFIGASNELGAFESGVAGELLGAPLAIALGGAATILVAFAWWVLFPALRDVDRFPTRAEPPAA